LRRWSDYGDGDGARTRENPQRRSEGIVGSVGTPPIAYLGEEAGERRCKSVPLQTEGTGWDTAHAAVFLASDEARWVTGVMLPIDGGFLAIQA
jgi:NAD(P)-dependent dehydrogenase (short-subunit alcohol dehydrogenase family)